MKERPILFQGAMVRAILAGTKTQTRRVLKGTALDWLSPDVGFTPEFVAEPGNNLCPYGQPGDRLWVREAWTAWAPHPAHPQDTRSVLYRADGGAEPVDRWRPSIHMPRWACRLVLEITAVRVERLQAISEADAIAEGIERRGEGWAWYSDRKAFTMDPVTSYRDLWESINGLDSWGANPWVWVVEFRRVQGAS